jgi:hypothetical protein
VTLGIAVVCESPADKETACALADRVLCEQVEWIDEPVLDAFRIWRGRLASEALLTWTDVADLAREHKLRLPHGFKTVRGSAPDELAARRAVRLLYMSPDRPAAILLIRDDDRQTDRKAGLERAREEAGQAFADLGPIVIGLAHLKRECWVLVGFIPHDESERERLAELEKQLGFHPCREAERLTAKHDHEERSAKRILAILTDSVRERECQCWEATPLSELEDRGVKTGLADYLTEVKARLVPLFRHVSINGEP